MTISATTAMTISSENPTSNMGISGGAAADARRTGRALRSALRLVLHFGVDGAAGDLARGLRLVVVAVLHAFLESAHRAAQVRPDVLQLLRSEDQQDDHQHDEPVPDAPRSHDCLLLVGARETGAA